MIYKMETEIGSLILEEGAIGSIVAEVLDQHEGKLWISNRKGKILGRMARLGGIDPVDYMEISMEPEGITVRLYLILKFGVSIRSITQQLISDIKAEIHLHTGLSSQVTIVVNGVLSKQLAKRHIEIKG